MGDVVLELRRQRALGFRGPHVDACDRAADEIELMRAALTAIDLIPTGRPAPTEAENAMRVLARQAIIIKEQDHDR